MSCTIDKLLIQGIRSFDPNQRAVIEFYKPITLIVGQNGAGKTTVIECLKYACTGEQPPNCRNGQAFIHDTRIAGERQVKAQIKLMFSAVSGTPIVVTRSLQLTQKAATQQCKTLESALQTYTKDGKKVSQSYRCADMDREVPELMGVSKAIIENVVFCHQEDSNWPLADSSTLKKKFDEIFAATRYTKALESLKKQRKEHAQSVKELKLRLETCAANRTQAHKYAQELRQCDAQLDSLRAEQADAAQRADTLERDYETVRRVITQHSDTVATIGQLDARIGEITRAVERMLTQLAEHAEPPESSTEIERELAQFSKRVATAEAEERRAADELRDVDVTRTRLQKKRDALAVRYGTLRQSTETLQRLVEQRDAELRQLAAKYEPLAEHKADTYSDAAVLRARAALDQLKDSLRAQVDRQSAQNAAQEAALADKESAARERAETATRLVDNHVRDASEASAKRARVADEIQTAEALVASSAEAAALLESAQAELAAAADAGGGDDAEAVRKRVEQLRAKQRAANADARELRVRLTARSAEAGEQARLETLQQTLTAARDELQVAARAAGALAREAVEAAADAEVALDGALHERLLERLESCAASFAESQSVEPSTASELRADIGAVDKQCAAAKASAAKERDARAAALGARDAVQARFDALESELRKKEAQLRKHVNADESFEQLLRDAAAKHDEARDEVATLTAAGRVYEKLRDESVDACGACQRAFAGDAERDAMRANLSAMAHGTPRLLKRAEVKLDATAKVHSQLTQLKPLADSVERLSGVDLPRARAELAEHKAIERHESGVGASAVESLSALSRALRAVAQACPSVRAREQKAQQLEARVAECRAKLSAVDGERPSTAQLEADIERLMAEALAAGAEADAATQRREEQLARTAKLAARVSELQADLGKTETARSSIRRLRDEMAALAARAAEHEAAASAARAKLPALNEALSGAKAALDKARKQHRAAAKDAAAANELFHSRFSAVTASMRQVDRAAKELGGADQVAKVSSAKDQVERKLLELDERQRDLTAQLETARTLQSNAGVTRRRLQDVLALRKARGDAAELQTERDALKASLPDALKASAARSGDAKQLEKQAGAARAKVHELKGKMGAIGEQRKRVQRELRRAEFVDIDKQYGEVFVESLVTNAAIKDLDRYYKALDTALIRFHAAKMAEINKIIRELWQVTYTGTDIDTIEIRSSGGASSAAGKRRTYDYRVVMLKGDVAIDMRGRCSAGQKVLSSIVIRLALAETFCLNCGILALDEPTTNLDRSNVESLATALVSIIRTRAKQSNFQLIIITHDEEFVELLGRSEYADYYWRVSKDQNGHSHLDRKDIAALC